MITTGQGVQTMATEAARMATQLVQKWETNALPDLRQRPVPLNPTESARIDLTKAPTLKHTPTHNALHAFEPAALAPVKNQPYKAKLILTGQPTKRSTPRETLAANLRDQPLKIPRLQPGNVWEPLAAMLQNDPVVGRLPITTEAEALRYYLPSSSETTAILIDTLSELRNNTLWHKIFSGMPKADALRQHLLLNNQDTTPIEHFNTPKIQVYGVQIHDSEISKTLEDNLRGLSNNEFATLLNRVGKSNQSFSISPSSRTRPLVESIINAVRNNSTVGLNLETLGQNKPVRFGTFQLSSAEMGSNPYRVYTQEDTVHAQIAEHIIAQPDSPRAMAAAAALIDKALYEANGIPDHGDSQQRWLLEFDNPNQHKIVGLLPTRVIYPQNDLLATRLMPPIRALRDYAQIEDYYAVRFASSDQTPVTADSEPLYLREPYPIDRLLGALFRTEFPIDTITNFVEQINAAKRSLPIEALPIDKTEPPPQNTPLYSGPLALADR